MLRNIIYKFRWAFVISTTLTILAGIGNAFVVRFVNEYLLRADSYSLATVASFLVILLVAAAFLYLATVYSDLLGANIIYMLRSQMVKRILQTHVETVSKVGTEKLLASLSSDLETVRDGARSLARIASQGATLIFISAYLLTVSVKMFLVTAVLTGLIAWASIYLSLKISRNFRQVRETNDDLYRDYQELLDAHREFKLNNQRARTFYYYTFQTTALKSRRMWIKTDKWYHLMMVGLAASAFAAVGLMFYVGTGLGLADFATTVTFVLSLFLFINTIVNMAFNGQSCVRSQVALQAMEKLELSPYQSEFGEGNFKIAETHDYLDLVVESTGKIYHGYHQLELDIGQKVYGSALKPEQALAAAPIAPFVYDQTSELSKQDQLIAYLEANVPPLPESPYRDWKEITFTDVTYAYRGSAVDAALAKEQAKEKSEKAQTNQEKTAKDLAKAKNNPEQEKTQTQRAGFALEPVNLTIKRDDLIFVIGKNGSGKSTLCMLLSGLHQPTSGTIAVDGVPVTDWAAYRTLVAAVFSDYHLFNSVLDYQGIPVAQNHANFALAQAWLELFELDSKVKLVDGILSTTHLSMGQKKRLGLLIAILEQRPLLLLDEWAADQDPSFRRVFYRKILPLLHKLGLTIVAISHDDAYFDLAQRIIVVAKGRVSQIASTTDSIKSIEFAEYVEAQ